MRTIEFDKAAFGDWEKEYSKKLFLQRQERDRRKKKYQKHILTKLTLD